MKKFYSSNFLRILRNEIPIDDVIVNLVRLEVCNKSDRFRFRCPLCKNFHTATNPATNLARCFDCKKNFNPIDLVMTVGKYSFIDAVELLKKRINR
jgi:DNA primase